MTAFKSLIIIIALAPNLWAQENDEAQALKAAQTVEREFLKNPEGKTPEGQQLYFVFADHVKKVASASNRSAKTIEYLVNLLGHSQSPNRQIQMSAYFPREELIKIWKRGPVSEQFLIREHLLLHFEKRLKQKQYKGISEIGELVINLLYEPGDKTVERLLTQVFRAPLGDEASSLVNAMRLRFFVRISSGEATLKPWISRSTGEMAEERSPELNAAYKRLSMRLQIESFVEAIKNKSFKSEDYVERTLLYSVVSAAARSDLFEVRIRGLELAGLIVENQLTGILDKETVEQFLSFQDVELERRLQSKFRQALRKFKPVLVDHIEEARKSHLADMDSMLTDMRNSKSEVKGILVGQIQLLLMVEGPVCTEEFVAKLVEILELAQDRGFDLKPYTASIERVWNLARAFGREDLHRRLSILTFGFMERPSCGGALSH